jgi:hypothetical protein
MLIIILYVGYLVTLSVIQDLAPKVIPRQKHHMNTDSVLSGYRGYDVFICSFDVLVQAGMHMVKWKTASLASSTQMSGYACVLYQTVTSLLDETVNMPIKSASDEYMDK